MKKLLALLIVLTMIIGIMPVVSADVAGYVAFDANTTKNAGCTVINASDDYFGTVRQATSSGTMKVNITSTAPCAMNSGEYLYVSFYYKTDTATAPGSFYSYGSTNTASGKIQFSYADTAGEWVRTGFFIPLSKAYIQGDEIWVRCVSPSSSGKIITIAEPKMIYTGSSNDITVLQSTGITGVSVAGTEVDLTANPTSCTAPAVVGASDIEVATTFGVADKFVVEKSADEKSLVVKVYAPTVDYLKEGAVVSATYTINLPEAAEFTFDAEYAMHSENTRFDGVIDSIADENVWTDTLTGTETSGTNFDTIYTFNMKSGTAAKDGSLSNRNNYAYFNGNSTNYVEEGDWVFIKFYARSLSSYTDEKGNTVVGNALRFYPRFNEQVVNFGGIQFFDTSNDTWKEYTLLIQADANMASKEKWELRFANIMSIAEETAGDGSVTSTVTFKDAQAQFAGLQILNIGKPVVASGTPSDAEIEAKIEEVLNTCGLTGIYRGDSEDNLYNSESNPLTIKTGPRYIANAEDILLTNSTVFGVNTADVVRVGNTYTISSYAPDYDWINDTGKKEQFTVNVIPEYDFYDFELNGLTLTLKADNGLDAPKTGVLIGASYDAKGKLLKLKAEPFSVSGMGNTLSVTIPESTEAVASLKFFVWDGVASGKPYVNTIRVDDVKDGTITQVESTNE